MPLFSPSGIPSYKPTQTPVAKSDIPKYLQWQWQIVSLVLGEITT
jgi:hypothetical protein